jgi:S-DNA-T family DNA segregation ATPase FtsK/SpoIIIE
VKLKLTYHRPAGPEVDLSLVVDGTARVADLARAIALADPMAGPDQMVPDTLAILPHGGATPADLSPDLPVVESPLGSGGHVALVRGGGGGRSSSVQRHGLAVLEVPVGPDAGRSVDLAEGSYVIGRDPECDIVLNDSFVSKQHARLTISPSGIEIVDLNSANGLIVDGGLVPRLVIEAHHRIVLGESTVMVTLRAGRQESPVAGTLQSGQVLHNRSPRVEIRYAGTEHPRPEVPKEHIKPLFPWPSLLLPVIAGLVSYAFTKSPYSLVMVALAPLMLLGNQLTSSGSQKRTEKHEIGRFEAQLERLQAELARHEPIERAVRQDEAPAVALVMADALALGPLLWTRRPEHWSFLNLRLGISVMPSRNRIAEPSAHDEGLPSYSEKLDEIVQRFRMIADVPVIDNLRTCAAIGVAGPPRESTDLARAYLVQLLGLHSPAELIVTALVGPSTAPEYEWLKWTPHATSPHSPFGEPLLSNSQASATVAVAALEELVSTRISDATASPDLGPIDESKSAMAAAASVGGDKSDRAAVPVVLVLVTDDAPVNRARLIQLAERAPGAAVYFLWVAPTLAALPAVCRSFVEATGPGRARIGLVRLGVDVDAQVDGVDLASAQRFARRLAPVIDGGALAEDASDLPSNVPLSSLLGTAMLESPQAVVDRWRENASIQHEASTLRSRRKPSLRALVGQQGAEAMHLDLRVQGPHALVGGTTGAGKSEFLQSWVLGMAAEYSPERVTFLFVDYKGGSAFADCVDLPHCVGLVTDLSPHLVRRALTSLKAELHHREHLFNAKKVKDLLELERKGDPESPPALVIVIDEFAALVGEVPEFVDGVIDVAQRGRSLGIHLIMATQRPAGVIRDNLRANTNMRIALRMADEHDSQDVIGDKMAAMFDPGLPGRAAAKTGPGRLAVFQSAYAGGWTTGEPEPVKVDISELAFGIPLQWREPESKEPEVHEAERGPTDQKRFVEQFSKAALQAEIRPPRRPWQPELSEIYELTLLRQRQDSELVVGVCDIPERQLQETAYFRPDDDGNLIVYGTGGSGKTVLLRTLAAAAGITPRSGPVEVYCLDFAAGGLTMLDQLPHVGAVIQGDDSERVARLMRSLRERLEERARAYPSVNAGSITEYREISGRRDEPRILLLIDNYPSFRDQYETVSAKSMPHDVLLQLLSEGRQLGIHAVLTADRPGTVPSAVSSSSPRRVSLRLSDEQSYALLDLPRDVLGLESPPGRALIDGVELQVAVLGGSRTVSDQSAAITRLASAIEKTGRAPAPPVGSLPQEFALAELPTLVDGLPALGLAESTLGPIGFDPSGTVVLAGGPGSGRTTAMMMLARSLERAMPEVPRVYLGSRRSVLAGLDVWTKVITDPAEIGEWSQEALEYVTSERVAIFVEDVPDLASSVADAELTELAKAVARSDSFLVGEGETSGMGAGWGLAASINGARRGLILQPETFDGDSVFKTDFPRVSRGDLPPGRGFYVQGGKVVAVQLPHH